jgi:hypothetical protein
VERERGEAALHCTHQGRLMMARDWTLILSAIPVKTAVIVFLGAIEPCRCRRQVHTRRLDHFQFGLAHSMFTLLVLTNTRLKDMGLFTKRSS